MSLLVLIRHAKSARKKAAPGSTDWPLSKKGRKMCRSLAELLQPLELDVLVSSPMLRARQTSELLAEELGLEWRVVDGLQEHERPLVDRQEAFAAQVGDLFAHPTRRAFGESAAETLARYTAAIDATLAAEPGRNVGIVSHGTVMALYAAPRFDLDPGELWDAIGQPCILVIDRETGRGLRRIDSFPDAE